MTHLYNDPADFRAEVIDGFSAAYGRYVDRVPDASGFVRRGGARVGKVSLIVGGGSGHYPSYAGIVGTGLADGCVLGDIFTSPSTEQIYRVAKAADGGAGIVLSFGNYAGDRLNFGAARERLIADGIDTRIVYVTDDVASAPPAEADQRRGIAGTVVVYKVGGSAADAGAGLDTVERLMRAANDATFTFGVAFSGCTFPAAAEPLFSVERGLMELGLGIHGEPGVRSEPWMEADQLAALLVDAVLIERPAGAGSRAAVILNGLGATKYEELFVLYGSVHRRLVDAGVEPLLPEVGELVTSLDMAGCSLSLAWLDDELAGYWSAPVDTAAFRRGDTSTTPSFSIRAGLSDAPAVKTFTSPASEESIAAAAIIRRALAAAEAAISDNEAELGRLDAVAGDGDHGAGMVRGMAAAVAAAHGSEGGVGAVLTAAGDAFADRAGGTSGMLWGAFLRAIGDALGNSDEVTPSRLVEALSSGTEAIQRLGRAQPGDKTMLDALWPFVDRFRESVGGAADIATAWRVAAATSTDAARGTASLTPKVGRARPLASRSLGSPDPGATSMALVLAAAGEVLVDLGEPT